MNAPTPGAMPHGALLDALRREAGRFAEVAAAAGPEATVPSCPGWTVGHLQGHLAGVFRFWTAAVERPDLGRDEVAELGREVRQEPAHRYAADLDGLLGAVERRDPADAAWSWTSDRSVGFVVRRLAHEVAVHRIDAELALGAPQPIDPELASDGIDEFLGIYLTSRRPTDPTPIGGSVHVHCTDVAGEWLVREVDGAVSEGRGRGLVVTREHAKGDVAARGAASDLLLAMWHRGDTSALDVVGDGAVLDRFLARLSV